MSNYKKMAQVVASRLSNQELDVLCELLDNDGTGKFEHELIAINHRRNPGSYEDTADHTVEDTANYRKPS